MRARIYYLSELQMTYNDQEKCITSKIIFQVYHENDTAQTTTWGSDISTEKVIATKNTHILNNEKNHHKVHTSKGMFNQ